MVRSMVRVGFALAVAFALAFGAFAGIGVKAVQAAGAPDTAGDSGPAAYVPGGTDYCYPTGYNRQGWRCGWRLAQAPYNLGDYYRYYYGYNYYYYYNYGYYYPYYGGTGGYPGITDYGGRPRFGGYWYNGYYYSCYPGNPYCWGYRK